MTEIPRVRLSEFFSRFAPTYVLGTTYTISLAFFEGLVFFPHISRTNPRRCLVLCDRIGFHRATAEAAALRGVSREYMTACAPARSSFHPKVWLMIGEDEIGLLVGSGNLTQSGFMDNTELFDTVFLEKGGPHRAVAEDLIVFLSGLRRLWAYIEDARLLAVETLREMQEAVEQFASTMPEDTERDLRFLTSFHGPLLTQFGEFFGAGGALFVAAPYFGGSVSAVSSLCAGLAPRQLKVFPAVHHDGTVDVPLAELSGVPGVSVHSLALCDAKRAFGHLKLYGFDSPRGQWLFTTSANCTNAALGGGNVEAGLMRRVKKTWLGVYFASRARDSVPTVQRRKASADPSHLLLLWASDRGGIIELVTGEESGKTLPLAEVELTLKLGGEVCHKEVPSLFDEGNKEQIPWEWFPHRGDRTKLSPLLTVYALSAAGVRVTGAAFVDHPLLLTADPVHRSAWRATLALLDREGLPEAADLASIFHLVHSMFDQEVSPDPAESGPQGRPGGRRPDTPIDKVPVWPPEPDNSGLAHFPRGGHIHSLQWFRQILRELLRSPRGEQAGLRDSTWNGEEEGASPEEPVPDAWEAKAARFAWDHAAESFDQLLRRLDEHEITRKAAPKIWPVAIAILLVTLATLRKVKRRAGFGLKMSSSETMGRFLHALFGDRCRGWKHGLTQDWDGVPTDPSVAEALYKEFAVVPGEEIADILLLLFASLHVRSERSLYVQSERSERQFPLNEWLLFREIAPDTVTVGSRQREDLRSAALRFFADEAEGVTWEHIAASLEALRGLGWDHRPGLADLQILSAKVRGKSRDGVPQIPRRLQDRWYQTECRLRSGKEWCYTVNRFVWYCAAPDCIANSTLDPQKRVLRELRPTICSTCGAVLVPDRLAAHLGSTP